MSVVVVTGASGFVGRRLLPALTVAGYDVVGLSTATGHIAHCEFPEIAPATVIHLAGRTFIPSSWQEPRDYYEVNVLGTVNVLEYCRRTRAHLLFLSSYLYGHPQSLPISEDDPLIAVNPYAHTKLLAEETCRFYREQFDLALTTIRPFNIYGPGQPEHFLIPSLIRQTLSPDSEDIVVADDRPRRDFIYIDDVIDLLIRATSHPVPGVYNAGSGTSYSIAEVVGVIQSVAGTAKPLRSRNERRPNDVMETRADISRARAIFNWDLRFTLQEGLSTVISAGTHGNR
jgi:nucleoside-diphosphate-sugar epimerase